MHPLTQPDEFVGDALGEIVLLQFLGKYIPGVGFDLEVLDVLSRLHQVEAVVDVTTGRAEQAEGLKVDVGKMISEELPPSQLMVTLEVLPITVIYREKYFRVPQFLNSDSALPFQNDIRKQN